jgi:hypothetical protein
MYQLTRQEFAILRLQIETSSLHGGRRYMPYAFIQEGIACKFGQQATMTNNVSIRPTLFGKFAG